MARRGAGAGNRLPLPDGCWFRVGNETRTWEPGKALMFDDTIEHEARNESAARLATGGVSDFALDLRSGGERLAATQSRASQTETTNHQRQVAGSGTAPLLVRRKAS